MRMLRLLLAALRWDTWGEPANEWQRGFIAGFTHDDQ